MLTAFALVAPTTSAGTSQRSGQPVAILTQIVGDNGVEITQADMKTPRKGALGDLLYADDQAKGRGVVVECRGKGSVQWFPTAATPYIGGKGVNSSDSETTGDCQMPPGTPTASVSHDNALTAQQLEAKLAATSGASTTDYDASAFKDLPSYDARDAMSVLRRAQALESRQQLKAAIDTYTELAHLWPKAVWVSPQIDGLRIALANKLLQTPTKPGQNHVSSLVVGISNYYRDDPDFPPLHFADLDGRSFWDYLKRADSKWKLDAPLLNQNASLANIREQLSRLRAQAGDGSTGVLFVSAHGLQDALGGYIATYDVHQRVGIDTAIPISELLLALSGFEQAYLFVDACRVPISTSKNNVNSILDLYGHNGYTMLGLPAPKPRLFILLSTGPGSFSEESSKYRDKEGPLNQEGHGAFTYHLLKSLYLGADAQPRRLSRGELQEQLRAAMKPQVPDWGGDLSVTAMLDPIQRIPFNPAAATKSLLQLFQPHIQLAAYRPEQDPQAPQDVLDQLRNRLRRGAINPAVAQQTMDGYRRLSPDNQLLVRSTIRTALEDEGERLLLGYLDGYQIEPQRDDFRRANLYYTLAAELAPNSLLLRARAAFNAGREMLFDLEDPTKQPQRADIFRAATEQLFDAYREDPGPYVLNALGIAYMENGDWNRAIPAFEDASRLAPQWLYPKHNHALSLMRSGKAQAAIQEYRAAIAEMPSAHTLHFNLALLYQQTNQLKDAEREYGLTRSLLLNSDGIRDSDWARLYNAQGTLAAQRGRKKQATQFYDLALSKTLAMPEAIHNKALISSPKEKEQLLVQNKAYLNSRIELAQIYKHDGKNAAAIQEYEEIVKQRPDFAGAHFDLAQLYLRDSGVVADRLRRATEQLDLASRSQPEFWKVYLLRAELAKLQGQNSEARSDYLQARKRAPDRAARSEISESEKGKWLH